MQIKGDCEDLAKKNIQVELNENLLVILENLDKLANIVKNVQFPRQYATKLSIFVHHKP